MAEWLITYRKDKDKEDPFQRQFMIEAATVDSAISALLAWNGRDCFVIDVKRLSP